MRNKPVAIRGLRRRKAQLERARRGRTYFETACRAAMQRSEKKSDLWRQNNACRTQTWACSRPGRAARRCRLLRAGTCADVVVLAPRRRTDVASFEPPEG